MKTHSSKKNEVSKSHSTKPFFTKKGNYFSPELSRPSSFFSTPTIQAKLTIGQPDDKFEKEADTIADQVIQTSKKGSKNTSAKPQIMKSGKKGGTKASPALANQLTKSKGKGTPLSSASNKSMSNKIGHDFSQVKIHTGEQAHQMNQSLNAKAFTHGSDIYFKKGQYNPNSSEGKHLLAHELTHVVQQSGGHQSIQKQEATAAAPATPTPAPAPVPRQDVVYVMGNDNFYRLATRFFRARFPNAVFVNNQRNLNGLLTHLTTTFTNPLGSIFIISHANEDGTLAFRLNSADTTRGLSVVELRNALNPQSGVSSLPTVGTQVDEQTRIEIKGCDLGRNQDIVELFDEAFNGQGTVNAPTHEQVYGYNSRTAAAGTTAAMSEHMETFEESLPEIPPVPTPVDRNLRGEERTAARREFAAARQARVAAQRARRTAMAAERRRFAPESRRLGQIAGTYEALSGPMFQHPGTDLFTADDLRPQVASLYDHLSEVQQESLITRLIRPDRRNRRQAHSQGVFRQQGQRQYRYEDPFRFTIPQNLAQARREFVSGFRSHRFRPISVEISSNVSNGETTYTYDFTGTRNREPYEMQFTRGPIPSNQALIDRVKAVVNNEDKFDWSITENQQPNGQLVKTVIRERVVCYLHHGSLNASRGDHFLPPETDRRFFAESTFTPPPPPSTSSQP